MSQPPRSQLPQDSEYWDELARKIGHDAVDPLLEYAAARSAWYGVLDRRAPWFVAASAAAMLLIWLALPPPDSSATPSLEGGLVPKEVAGTLIAGPEPPSVDVLLVQFPPPIHERRQ